MCGAGDDWHTLAGEELGISGVVLRFRVQDVDGAPRVTEMHLDGCGTPIAGADVRRLPVHMLERWATARDASHSSLALARPPDGRLTDEFLSNVAQNYEVAVAQRKPPAKAIAALVGVSPRTVHRWIYCSQTARPHACSNF